MLNGLGNCFENDWNRNCWWIVET